MTHRLKQFMSLFCGDSDSRFHNPGPDNPYFGGILFLFLFTFIFFLLPFFSGCQKQTTPVLQNTPVITLSVEHTGVREVWLYIQVENYPQGAVLKLLRNDISIYGGVLTGGDTTVEDSGLLPAHPYTYRCVLMLEGQVVQESQTLTATTLDTTSHHFVWRIDTFGYPTTSALRDVVIINENSIWAVGEIYADSARPWLPYNAVHWDGQQWELKRITYDGSPWSIRSIFAFSANDIWFDAFVRWNGTNFIQLSIPSILIGHSINKIWGTSSNDLYVVGSEGLIAHYDGSWQKLESGTTTPINDIWGAVDDRTGEASILCTVSNKYHAGEYRILTITKNNTDKDTLDWTRQRRVQSVWFDGKGPVYVCGSGVYRYKSGRWNEMPLPAIYTNRIRGNAVNDIFVVGDFGLVTHYNGSSWQVYPQIQFSQGGYVGLAVKGDLVVAVGYGYSKAIILTGRRVH